MLFMTSSAAEDGTTDLLLSSTGGSCFFAFKFTGEPAALIPDEGEFVVALFAFTPVTSLKALSVVFEIKTGFSYRTKDSLDRKDFVGLEPVAPPGLETPPYPTGGTGELDTEAIKSTLNFKIRHRFIEKLVGCNGVLFFIKVLFAI